MAPPLARRPWHVPVVVMLVTVAQSQNGIFPGADAFNDGSIPG